jgi:hypothetical protein
MAYQNSLSGRLEELRFPSLRSPEHDTFASAGQATSRPETTYYSTASGETRSNLPRRFTTDASKMPLARPFGGQFNNMAPSVCWNFLFPVFRARQCPLAVPSALGDASMQYKDCSMKSAASLWFRGVHIGC